MRDLPPRAQRVGVEKCFEHLLRGSDDDDREVEAGRGDRVLLRESANHNTGGTLIGV